MNIGSYYKTVIPDDIFTASNSFRINFDFEDYQLQNSGIEGIKYDSDTNDLYFINSNGTRIRSVYAGEIFYYRISSIVGIIPTQFEDITINFDSGTFDIIKDLTGVMLPISFPTTLSVNTDIPSGQLGLFAGYTWYDFSIEVTMAGVDITSLVYDEDTHTLFNGTLNIAGRVVIKATARRNVSQTVTHEEGDNTTFSGSGSSTLGSLYIASLVTDEHFYINNITVTNNGVDVTETAVTFNTARTTAYISLTCNGEISIIATDTANPLMTHTLTGVTGTYPTVEQFDYYSAVTETFTLSSGYSWYGAEVTVIMGQVDITSTAWNGITHTLSIAHITDHVTVTIKASILYTYTVKNNSGGTTYTSDEAGTVKTIEFTLSGTTRTLNLGGLTLTYSVPIPTGKKLIGLTLTANSDRLFIGVGFSGAVNLQGATFYEVVVDESEVPTGCTLNLYQNKSDSNEVNKDLTLIGTLEGTMREPTDIINPVITIAYGTLPNFNYVYIPQLKRYYFINDIVSVRAGLWALSLKVDVLTSYKDLIYSQVGFISRQENEYNNDLVDDERVVTRQPEVIVQDMVLTETGKFAPYFNKTTETEIDAQVLVTVVRKDR